jgi:hypothetical protein
MHKIIADDWRILPEGAPRAIFELVRERAAVHRAPQALYFFLFVFRGVHLPNNTTMAIRVF